MIVYQMLFFKSNTIVIKYADYTTIIGLIPFDNEKHYRIIVAEISEWCEKNDLELDIRKNSHHALQNKWSRCGYC